MNVRLSAPHNNTDDRAGFSAFAREDGMDVDSNFLLTVIGILRRFALVSCRVQISENGPMTFAPNFGTLTLISFDFIDKWLNINKRLHYNRI